MVMLGEAVENRTGIVNCFSIHPKSNFLLKYNEKELQLGLLSALMKKETQFTMLIDGKINNFFNPKSGAGLFQINFFNAQQISKKLNIQFSTQRLKEDIQYNFMIMVEFINKLIKWIGDKHIINWIVSYNSSIKSLLKFQNLLKIYNISNYNKEIQSLYGPFALNIIPTQITKSYGIHVLSYLNNNNYFLLSNYVNIFISDINPWF